MTAKRKDNKGRVLHTGEIQKKNGRYEFRYYDTNGKRRSVYSWRLTETDQLPDRKKPCPSLRSLEQSLLHDVYDGLQTMADDTLNVCWERYINGKLELKQSTRTNYRYMYNKYIRDTLGSRPMQSIKYSNIREFFNHLIYELGFKPASVEVINTILHPVFNIAMRDGLIRLNPTDGIMADLKRSNVWEKPKRHSLTEDQQKAFMSYVADSETYHRWYPLFICLLGTGCRIGEMLGLRWEDVLWSDNLISINHNLIYRLQDNGKVEFHITTPKTKNSVLVIPMFQIVRDALRQEFASQEHTGFCKDTVDGYTGFIWQTRSGNVLSPHCVNRAIAKVVDDYNKVERMAAIREQRSPLILPHFSAHQFRHTFCTRLCERETDLKLIQEIMGHSNITTTMDIYNESNTKRKKASFERLEALASFL